MLQVFCIWPMQKTCQLQRAFDKNLEQCIFLILQRGVQTLTFMGTISSQNLFPMLTDRILACYLCCAFCLGVYTIIFGL